MGITIRCAGSAIANTGHGGAVSTTGGSRKKLPVAGETQVMGDRIFIANHVDRNAVRPFKGASRSEPDMEYIEEPSMLYMAMLISFPFGFSMWFLTKFV